MKKLKMEDVEVCHIADGGQGGSNGWKRTIMDMIRIDPFMLPTKFTYFFWGGLIGSWQLFINAFFISVGLSASQAGFITGLMFLASSITGPLWGMLTDYTGRRKSILLVLSLVSAASICSLPFVANAFADDSNIAVCDKIKNSNSSNSSMPESTDINCDSTTNDLFQVLLLITILGAIFTNTLPNYMEAIVMDVVDSAEAERKTSYGGQRIVGSIGTCVWVYVSGLLVDNYRFEGMSQYTAVFIMYAPFAMIMIPTGCYLNSQASSAEKKKALISKENTTDRVGIIKHLQMMFSQFDVIFFMLTVLVAGIAFNLNIYFGVLLVKEQIKNISQTEISVVFVTSSVFSILMFPLTDRIITFLRGPFIPITFGILAYCVRYSVMSYTTTYWVMVAIQVCHCIGFALLWSAVMHHVDTISPKKIKVTMILISQTVHFGISPILLNMAGGSIIKAYSSKILFQWDGILCGIWGTLLVAYCCRKYYNGKTKLSRKSITEEGSSTETFLEGKTVDANSNSIEVGDVYYGKISTKQS